MDTIANYPKFSVGVKEFMNFFGFSSIKVLNPNLYNLLSLVPSINVINISCGANGLRFNISTLKGYLATLFGISLSNNPIQVLEDLNHKVDNSGIQVFLNRSKSMKYLFKASTLGATKVTKKEKNLFKLKMQKVLALFVNLLQDEEKYSKVEHPLITTDSLNFFVAYSIFEQAKKWERWNDKAKVSKYQIFLLKYLNANPHLIESNYSIGNKRISHIYEYIFGKKKEVKEEENDTIERYDYTFLESENTKEMFTHIQRLGNSDENDDDLKEYFQRKIALYQSINYLKIKVGVESFNGYIGFVLQNGYVILDKLFESLETGKIAKDNAIYVIKESDFEVATRTSKTKMIEAIALGEIEAERIIHSGNYEERVRKYLLIDNN